MTEEQNREAIAALERKVDSHIIKLGKVCECVQQWTGEHPCRPGEKQPVRWRLFKALIRGRLT